MIDETARILDIQHHSAHVEPTRGGLLRFDAASGKGASASNFLIGFWCEKGVSGPP